MSKRVSYSPLDPFISPLVPPLYRLLHIPKWFPPEGIILVGHLCAIGGACAFAWSVQFWWAGLLAALGVMFNHVADMVDGTHARSSGQCRNGGEMLDHFTDPLSFSYWMIGLAIAAQSMTFGFITVICIYATSVLTNIKAKMTGEFSLARFGPTEFKALLMLIGIALTVINLFEPARNGMDRVTLAEQVVFYAMALLSVIGVVQLSVNLYGSVRMVNRQGAAPADTSQWEIRG